MDLFQDGTIENIKLDDRKIDSIKANLKFLFYEIKDDLANEIEGGYRVELSFQEETKNACGLGGTPN